MSKKKERWECAAFCRRPVYVLDPFLMHHSDPLLAHVIEVSRKYPCVLRGVLFGSRAKGTAASQSDYDIAVDWEGEGGVLWGCFVHDVIEDKPLLKSVDLLNLQCVGADLRSRIEMEGLVFYEKE